MEILTTSSANHGPSRDWLNIVKTSQAKNQIKQWFKKERREENIIKGKEMLEREAKRQGYTLSQLLKNEWVESIWRKYGFHSLDDMYSAIGYGGITTNQVLLRLIDEYKKTIKSAPKDIQDLTIKEGQKAQKEKKYTDKGVQVKGIGNVMIRFSKCCNPLPGDDIIGYITRGRGVSIHRTDCINLEDPFLEKHRLIEVNWTDEHKASYSAEIQIIANDRQGLLADITKTISEMKINVTAVNARTTRRKQVVINLTLEINGIDQLDNVMKQFKKMADVIEVFRVNT